MLCYGESMAGSEEASDMPLLNSGGLVEHVRLVAPFLAETDVCSYGCPNYALMCLFVLTIA